MSGSMARRRLEDDGLISEHIVLVIADDWEVFLIAEEYPALWRELSVEDLFLILTGT